MTAKTAAGEPAVYVFGTPVSGEGYLIVSAESEAPALLGYSDRGSVSAETMLPAMHYWLETYTRQIEAARQSGRLRQLGTACLIVYNMRQLYVWCDV